MKDNEERGFSPPNKHTSGTSEEQNWYNRPHGELVAHIKTAVAKARADAEKEGLPFDPIEWAGMQLTRSISRASGRDHLNRLDASLVWDAISRPYIQDKRYKTAVEQVLINGTALRGGNLVTLPPEAVTLIDAMTDATGVPHKKGQNTFDLLNDDQKKLFRQIHTKIAEEKGI